VGRRGRGEKLIQVLLGKPGNGPLVEHEPRWEDKIETCFEEMCGQDLSGSG
jgi:hypothetical protein